MKGERAGDDAPEEGDVEDEEEAEEDEEEEKKKNRPAMGE